MDTLNYSNPQTELSKILEIVGKIVKISADGYYIYRGESQCHPKVSSTLYRALEKVGLLDEHDIEAFQRKELEYAKTCRYTQKTDDFKILTEIQHFGGKTNLLDFTTDYLIALFFACDSSPFKDGRVILQDRNGEIKDWIIEPCNPYPESRVGVQKSIFVRPSEGFIEPDFEIVIPKFLKQPVLKYLEKEFDISPGTIYPDLHGFVSSQDTRWNIYEDISKGNDHLESGQEAENPDRKFKDYQKAVKHFTNAIDNAIQLVEGLAVAYDGRGSAYLSIGELENSNDQIESAIADFTEAIKLKSDYPSAYNNRGRAYFTEGELENAIKDFSKAVELMPRCPEAYHYRGLAYFRKGNSDNAIADLNEVIRLNPNDVVAYHRRGIVYLRNGDFDSAIIDLDKAIHLNPNDDLVYYSRGETWLHLKEWDKARVDLAIAKDEGVDIVAAFHNSYRDVATFERRNSVKLPQDIVAMLRQYPVNSFTTTQRVLTAEGETQESFAVLELLEKFRNTGKPLSEYLQKHPSRGITTGCNEAFIVEHATREALIAEHALSADVLKPFLMARDIQRWRVKPTDESRRESQDKWLIFAHRGIKIDVYPAIRKHLEKYSDVLKKRSGKQKWYELSVAPADTDRFTQPKCIYANMASETAFAFDDEGYYVGSPASLLPTSELWFLGVLNTKAVSWFYARTAPQIRGPFLKF
ncbi:MAG: tetratricopeptide repeat protein, partial [Candidatus Poribacteria bacterium]|nr:tetratricopeptide repeat protein [Candidatus Poribacteria bacterium]